MFSIIHGLSKSLVAFKTQRKNKFLLFALLGDALSLRNKPNQSGILILETLIMAKYGVNLADP